MAFGEIRAIDRSCRSYIGLATKSIGYRRRSRSRISNR